MTPAAKMSDINLPIDIDIIDSSANSSAARRLLQNPLGLLSIVVLSLIVLASIILPIVLPYHWDTPTQNILASPSAQHWLGTDDSGYDILVRLAEGARISLSVGIGVEAIVVVVGTLVGLTAGYFGGRADTILMRVTDMMFAFPDILLAILIMAIRGPGMANLFAALAVTYWAGLARLVRGQTMVLKRREFVEASRAIGTPTLQILAYHILPNLLSPLIVASTLDIAGVIIGEATLSFLGVGLPDPMPSWGRMIANPLMSGYWQGHPSLVVYPALCLTVTVLSVNFLGDALRDALDPRSK